MVGQGVQAVVVGAGPVGLFVAAELRLAGVSVVVLEERLTRDPNSKALTIHPRTIEILASRGLEPPFLAEAGRLPSGHFATLDNRMDFRLLDTDFQFTLALPQERSEELLEDNARRLGADIRRGHRFTGYAERDDCVTVLAEGPDGPYELAAEFLLGCDGVRSLVRRAAGIPYPGTDFTVLGWLGDVVLADPPPTSAHNRSTMDGGVLIVELPGGMHRIVGQTPKDVRTDWPGEMTLDELRANVVAITGTDFGMRSPTWLSRFGNASRQAENYRKGRVLLAGDAAHQHMPAGGVGMNAGIQDAMNLGWKVAATINGWAADGLLDSYHAERHPVGEDLLQSTQAQTALMTVFSPDGQQLRTLISTLIAETPAFARVLAERLSGLAVRYPAADADAHPLTGTRAPNLAFDTGGSVFELLRSGRYVALDLGTDRAGDEDGPAADHPWLVGHRGRPLAVPADWAQVRAALIRPDGHVAWVGTTTDPADLDAVVKASWRTTRPASSAANR
ncbi:MAG TPA: FAD-dependent monooxygenase [Pseudonocardiaceae bacterium]|nr:FAD-dependent monooxygenase [Pseudonocardiaceae bacterium]